MSVQSEITRIQAARNALRTKAVSLGIGASTDNLTTLAVKYGDITDRGTPAAEVREGESYTINAGYYHGGTVTGVAGGGSYTLQAKSDISPISRAEQTISPDSGYYGLSSVKISALSTDYQNVYDVSATAGDVLTGKTIVNTSGNVAGTMVNNGAISQTLTTATTSYTIPVGYHNGLGSVNIVTENKTATPDETTQNITPSTGKVLAKVTVNPIPANYGDATDKTATEANILNGQTAIGWDSTNEAAVSLTGTMTNNGAVSPAPLDCGESYTIPEGYHNGSGIITTNTLASQTGVDTDKTAVSAEDMVANKQAWVNGTKVTGTMVDRGTVTKTLDATTNNQSFTIASGKHSGSGSVNIVLEQKTTAPSYSAQTITPTAGKVLSQVTVSAIPASYVNASTVDAVASNVLYGKKAVVNTGTNTWAVATGTMANNGTISGTITGLGTVTGDTSYTIPAGYTSGGTVSLTNDIETALAAI